jgi:hypothetical protein
MLQADGQHYPGNVNLNSAVSAKTAPNRQTL